MSGWTAAQLYYFRALEWGIGRFSVVNCPFAMLVSTIQDGLRPITNGQLPIHNDRIDHS